MSLENSPKELDGWLMAKTTKRARARVAEIFIVWLFFGGCNQFEARDKTDLLGGRGSRF